MRFAGPADWIVGPRTGMIGTMLGLPDSVMACLFDLDGVLTDTASVHRAAWKDTFDPLLAARGQRAFTDADYIDFVDGKPRADGVRDFLASRGIVLAEGSADDAPPHAGGRPAQETVHGVGNRKNELLLERIERDGVHVYEGSRRYLQAAQRAGLRRAVVSSSANTAQVLQVTGLAELIEVRVDGVMLVERGIPGKPAPDSFLAGAELLGVDAGRSAVFEDALAGVSAARAGGFGYVVGVNRADQDHADALRAHGASIVVNDVEDLL